ncbi:signal peptidase complex subunit 1 [Brachionus plicatilis]|uniref:Signal peptidase complex subunit 1 n=1 Tax=Brachionus plicatilis TaxID=10195 RepID=A0A3M7QDE2_BRAPC|nr:signal peptidase complex subunit 1 [Brachionus plicatilis]
MVLNKIPTSIDFVGQKRAELLFQVIIVISAIIGFIYGFLEQKFSYTLMALGVGVTISALAVLPPWPAWKKNPLKWQEPKIESKTEEKTKNKK